MSSPAASSSSFVSAEQLHHLYHHIAPAATAGDHTVKGLHESSMNRQFVNIFEPKSYCLEDVTFAVESCMKKHADDLLHSLDGIAGRLSQLEVHCYKLERSVGALRSNMMQDHNDTDLKLKLVEKQIQEVQKSLQILQDKQELAETQKELAKLQLLKDEVSCKAESSITSPAESKESDEKQVSNYQLAVMPLHQAAQMLALQVTTPKMLHVQANAPQPHMQQFQPFQKHQETHKSNEVKSLDVQSLLPPLQDQQNQSPPQPAFIYVRPKSQVHDFQMGSHITNSAPPLQHQPVLQSSSQQYQLHMPQPQHQTSNLHVTPQATQEQPPSPLFPVKVQDGHYLSQQLHQVAHQSPETFSISAAVRPQSKTIVGGYESLNNAVQLLPRHQTLQSHPAASFIQQGLSGAKAGSSDVSSFVLNENIQSYHSSMSCAPNIRASVSPPQPFTSTGLSGNNYASRDTVDRAVVLGYSWDQMECMPQRMVAAGQLGNFNASP